MSDDSRNASNIRLVSDQPLLGTEVFIEGQKVYGLTYVEYESNMEKPDQMTITFNVESVNGVQHAEGVSPQHPQMGELDE